MSNYVLKVTGGDANSAYQIQWERKYQRLLRKFLQTNFEFDGSAVAAWMRRQGLEDPVHHNLWGLQIRYYARLKWMTPIGRIIPSGAAHIAQVRHWRSSIFIQSREKQ